MMAPMDLGTYVDRLRYELGVAAETGGEDARALAERLVAPLESTTRLVLLEALSAAADEITRELAPGSVDVRLRGREPTFVVTRPPGEEPFDETAGPAPEPGRRPCWSPTTAPPPGSTCGCPTRSRPGSRRPPAGSGSRSTPGWSGPRPPRSSRTTGHRSGAARGGQRYSGWVR